MNGGPFGDHILGKPRWTMRIGAIHQFAEPHLVDARAIEKEMGVDEIDLFADEVNAEVAMFVEESRAHGIPVTSLSPRWGWVDRALKDPDEPGRLRSFIQAGAGLGIERIMLSCSFVQAPSQAQRQRVIDFFRGAAGDAERAAIDLCVHTTTRPSIMFGTPAGIDAFLEDVGSERVRLLFCCGCISVAGWEVNASIRRWKNAIGAVHLFNPRGDWAGYDEMRFDRGQLDMVSVLKTLDEIGYEGILLPHEYPAFSGACGKEISHGWVVGYLRAALQAVAG
jgi:sugar phosphate isomerase/epimerase